MNYCQFRNDFIKRMANAGGGGILPAEYQQVEYIGSTSSTLCYFDTTINNDLPLEFETETQAYYTGEILFGTYGSNNRFFVQPVTNSGKTGVGYSGSFGDGTITVSTRTWYKLNGILRNGEQKIYVNDNLSVSKTYTGTMSPVIPISVFCGRISETLRGYKYRGEMKYLKLWSNGTPIFDGIPCYRKTDNVSGFYDTVTKTLYSSLSGSNFVVGADV